MDENIIINILRKEMMPGLGVTEPASIALSSAKAYEVIGGEIKNLKIIADPGLFKNAFSCAIPGTKEVGNEMAALLGAICGDASLGLECLRKIKKEDVSKAKTMLDKIHIEIKSQTEGLYVESIVTTNNGIGRTIIRYKHDNIVLVEKNNKILYQKENTLNKSNNFSQEAIDSKKITEMKLDEIVEFVNNVNYEKIEFLLESIKMNKKLSEKGLEGLGIGLGKLILESCNENNYELYAEALTCSAIDARVSGATVPAMTVTGSGNHGIITTLPLLAIKEKKNLNNEVLARSIALSYIINIYIKEFSGKLSAFCGCAVAAGTGVSAGICYLLGGSLKEIENTIKNMASNITGMICTGGNLACSLKANTGVKAAFLSAKMALNNIVIPNKCGIVSNSIEDTMKNIGRIAYPGMMETDKEILNIMIESSK
ncbi:TPA: serine dehydratase subunit alpha family protein [Clostridium botulinum]|uniref:L-cysteine desulfidase family protein n=1 Tax=Clostridium botulinum TaxID=1491 RepID=UPI000D0C9A03|nr:L-serine ammonia-lyase, iron-sulfur-dependent, subunit alpha [Clostridium botulinum]PSM02423.1 serine dehydratase subunit alpha family protein [Clostridium botulinum]HDK7136915.1 serine dehydratase subunit alpha family protein [Clostridium botulinum]HDK7140549.1 serine dehydratase subunit alpha family protein [Clostridium botulinum]HDK7144611.1 serine dehydratase subunit alpha family protein [Clostridium botulinum]HDK7148263.1 serine dehydratase subunit alpha family protein [Clostridium bot